MRQSSIVQRCQVEELKNHLFYSTLTYNDESLPVLVTSTGYLIRYADIRDFTLMVKRLRKSNVFGRPFKVLYVSELGEKTGRPHFHAIWSVEKYCSDTFGDILNLESVLFKEILKEWRRNYGSTRSPDYRPLCTYVRKFVRGKLRTNYDVHYMNSASSVAGNSDVAFYVSKYMFKPSDRVERLQQALHLNLDLEEYDRIWSVVKPRFHASVGFGMADTDYVRKCIEDSKGTSEFPKFYNPVSGQSFPLSRYYSRKGVLTMEDALFFNSKSTDKEHLYDDSDVRKFYKLYSYQLAISNHDRVSTLFDEL